MICAIVGGTGSFGAALALRLAQAGHRLRIGSRSADKALAVADGIVSRVPGAQVLGGGILAVIGGADLVFVTVPYAAHADTMALIAPHVSGTVIVDTTAPLRPPKVGTVQLPAAGSAAMEAQAILGRDAKLVSALQTIGAKKLGSDAGIECDVLAASDDAEAVALLAKLLASIGFKTWHIGPLANAAAGEALTSVLIQINRRYKIPQAGIKITGTPELG